MSLEDGKKIADAILLAQLIGREIPKPTITQDGKIVQFKEQPRPLSYYYTPYRHAWVGENETKIIFEFNLPSNRALHIHQIGNNQYYDSFSEFKIDGTTYERVERIIGEVNNPLNVRGRYIIAYHHVKWITTNQGKDSILAAIVIDGTIYHVDDIQKIY